MDSLLGSHAMLYLSSGVPRDEGWMRPVPCDISRKEDTMALTLECPVCEAEVPLETDDRSGDLVQCSYCKETLKLLRTKDKWILTEEFDE